MSDSCTVSFPLHCKMSSRFGLVMSELMSQSAICAFLKSSSEIGSWSRESCVLPVLVIVSPVSCVDSFFDSAGFKISFTRSRKLLKSSSVKRFSSFLGSNDTRHSSFGMENSIGASRRMVASVFEKSASSSPSSKSFMMRSLMPTLVSAAESFLSVL